MLYSCYWRKWKSQIFKLSDDCLRRRRNNYQNLGCLQCLISEMTYIRVEWDVHAYLIMYYAAWHDFSLYGTSRITPTTSEPLDVACNRVLNCVRLFTRKIAEYEVCRSTMCPMKRKTPYSYLKLHQILTDFRNSVTCRLSGKSFCSKVVIKEPTTPHTCCYTTLWNINVRKLAPSSLKQDLWSTIDHKVVWWYILSVVGLLTV